MTWQATHGGREVEIRAVPHDTLGTAWRVEIDGDPVPYLCAGPDEAKWIAEVWVGAAMTWREDR